VELINDYDYVIDYHPIMVNVVTNALIRKERAMVDNTRIKEHGSLVELKKIGLWLSVGLKGSLLARLKIQSVLQDKVLEAQQTDEKTRKIKEKMNQGMETPFQIFAYILQCRYVT
jgi:heme exporter protein D